MDPVKNPFAPGAGTPRLNSPGVTNFVRQSALPSSAFEQDGRLKAL